MQVEQDQVGLVRERHVQAVASLCRHIQPDTGSTCQDAFHERDIGQVVLDVQHSPDRRRRRRRSARGSRVIVLAVRGSVGDRKIDPERTALPDPTADANGAGHGGHESAGHGQAQALAFLGRAPNRERLERLEQPLEMALGDSDSGVDDE